MFRNVVLLVGGMASLWTGSLFAQDAVLGMKYGLGVHAYFAGDYPNACQQLTGAIDCGSKDPRVFYFRGLTELKLGRTPDANLDFQAGATLESRDFNKFYNVAKSLERVQGADRSALECFRVNARMAALQESERARKARYEAIRRDEERVLRDQTLIPTPLPDAAKTGTADQPTTEVDPFATPDDKAAPGVEKKPAKAAQPAKKPAEMPAAEGEEKPAAPAVPAAPAAPAAPSTEDPFATKPAAEKKPAAEEKKPDEKKADPGDPFAS